MDRTTRLIQNQRLTIVALAFTAVSAVAHTASETIGANAMMSRDTEAKKALDQLKNAHEDRIFSDIKAIHDLYGRVRRYEAKYGDIDGEKSSRDVEGPKGSDKKARQVSDS